MDQQNPLGNSSSTPLEVAIEKVRQYQLPIVSKQDLEQTTAVIETLVETPEQLHLLLKLIFARIAKGMAENPTPDGSADLV